jgi:acetyltransferase-like isoleucine patch superfamily enzyme
MFDICVWVFFRRFFYSLKLKSFKSSFISYADKHSAFMGFNRLYAGSIVKRSHLGKFTYIAGARIQSSDIGNFCSIGPGTRIGGLGRHPTNWVSTHPAFFSTLKQANIKFCDQNHFEELAEVRIGNDVWIGAGVLVLDGVKIGHGAVIGAGAVVNKDVEPYAIVGGVPAKLIRYRYDTATIQRLLVLAWWDWPTEKLEKIAYLIRGEPSDQNLKLLESYDYPIETTNTAPEAQ